MFPGAFAILLHCLLRFFIGLLQVNETSLEDVTHEEAVATLKKTQDRVVIVIARGDFTDSAVGAPPPRYQDAVKSSKLYNTILYTSR